MAEVEPRAGHRPGGASQGAAGEPGAEPVSRGSRDADRPAGLAGDLARAFAGPGGTRASRPRAAADPGPYGEQPYGEQPYAEHPSGAHAAVEAPAGADLAVAGAVAVPAGGVAGPREHGPDGVGPELGQLGERPAVADPDATAAALGGRLAPDTTSGGPDGAGFGEPPFGRPRPTPRPTPAARRPQPAAPTARPEPGLDPADHSAVQLPPSPALLCDASGIVLHTNAALRRLAGSADPTGMKLPQLLVGPDSDARLVRADRRLARVKVVRWPQPGNRSVVLLTAFPDATAAPSDEAPALDLERATRSGTWTFDLQAGTLTRSEGLVELYRSLGVRPDGVDGPIEGEQVERVCRLLRRGPDELSSPGRPAHSSEIRPEGGSVLSCRTRIDRTPGGAPLRLIGTVQDVTDRRRAESRAQRSGQRFAELVATITTGVAMLDGRGRIVDANPALCRLLDADLETLRGVPARSLSAEPQSGDRDGLPDWLRAPSDQESTYRIDSLPLLRADGTRVDCEVVVNAAPSDDGRPFWLLVVTDVGERRRAADVLREAHTVDPLTRLPNRAGLLELADRALAGPDAPRVAVVVGDVDDFARVNTGLGHADGDTLLVELAGRLQRDLPSLCTAGRLAGDEFAVVCVDVDTVGGPQALGATVAELLRGTVTVGGRPVTLTASVGVATPDAVPAGPHPPRGDDLLRSAEITVQQAKQRGRGTVGIADRGTVGPACRQLELEAELRAAIESDALRLEYQPVVAPDGTVLSAEALLRWSHPVHGEVSPGEFLPVAQRSGLQRDLDLWVLRTATAEAATWPRHGQRIAVAVNLAGLLPADPAFLDEVTAVVEGSGLGWDQLVLELVETSLVALPRPALDAMSELVRRGVRFAVDDFGTGYSSLARLKELPAQTVKVDRAFVTGVGTDPADFALARAVVEVARAMGRATVAEGVETAEQFHVLRGLGVNAFQGWLFARSLRPDDLHRVLRGGGLPTPATTGTPPGGTPGAW
ncbi:MULTISPECIES: GGDEF domain-containing phosphodiesterase [Pseudonocardia]|uniref:Cyclic di-GMP phosphodiesterase Gmr n=1 Tax=Pseudonocardia autotrophica TaxID=2074 RepID=A0A1Y2N0E1_PSEAH|nr:MULTISPECIES: GGDEF domain-containing phosphodiesterase [Pseudonocardia]OSY40567.1 Cyclic di-GMP phosphodiesterase Gmr [Pseudonocardia autotrophica]TDN73637.1 PAS domain S-box-containing protein/diguanylate cyclase (GGDEF)-like protein [Pseudonocardia autotrophica]